MTGLSSILTVIPTFLIKQSAPIHIPLFNAKLLPLSLSVNARQKVGAGAL
jgi:hypothetical protein